MKTRSSATSSPAAKRQPEAGFAQAAEVAHGLNNTLMVLNGFSELLLGAMSECDPHRRYVEEIHRAAQHAAELTQQLLTRDGQTSQPLPAKVSRASRALRELAHDHFGHETILLVEDDEAVRDPSCMNWRSWGTPCLRLATAWKRSACRRGGSRAGGSTCLTDVVMPGMAGCMLASRLRESQPGLKVAFSSGYARNVALGQSPRNSSDGFLAKPYNAAALAYTICEMLGE